MKEAKKLCDERDGKKMKMKKLVAKAEDSGLKEVKAALEMKKDDMEKEEKKKKEGGKKGEMCAEECHHGWCEENCKKDCEDCDEEKCPKSCSDECQNKCHGCVKCHMAMQKPEDMMDKVMKEVCGDVCMDGWC